MPVRLSTDSQSANCFQRQLPSDSNTVGALLAAAVCLLLLDVPECSDTSGLSDVTAMVTLESCGEISVVVGEVDRHMLVAGIDTEFSAHYCVWSRIGNTAIVVMGLAYSSIL